jgi:hypothetical protein
MTDNGELKATEAETGPDERHAGQRQSFKQRWRKLTVGNQITAASNVIIAATTGLYVLVSVLTWLTVSRSSKQTSKQVGKLIDAANIQACAAQKIADASDRNAEAAKSFSTTADKIRGETARAVGELKRAANDSETAMKENSRNAQNVLNTSIEASKLDQRAWFGISDFEILQYDPNDTTKPFRMQIVFRNSGKTPARQISELGVFQVYSSNFSGPTDEDWKTFLNYFTQSKERYVAAPKLSCD